MKTWRLSGGDLVLGRGGFQTVTGVDRIMQQLRAALGEPLGIDRFHPGWGSQIDDLVGLPLDGVTLFELEQEVNRVVGNYITVQDAKITRDRNLGVRARYSQADVLARVEKVDITSRTDSATITITIGTAAGDRVTSEIEVEAQ